MTSLAKLVLADTGGVGRQVTLNNLNAVVDFPSRVCLVLWYGTHRFSDLLADTGGLCHLQNGTRFRASLPEIISTAPYWGLLFSRFSRGGWWDSSSDSQGKPLDLEPN